MNHIRCAILVGTLCFVVTAFSCDKAVSSGGSFESGDYNPAFVEKVDAMRTRIRAQAATQPVHPLAGTYYQGDGLGINLTLDLAPSGAYTLSWYGCLGLYHLEHGTVTFTGDNLRLLPAPGTGETSLKIDRELVRVPWGERRYLIASSEMPRLVERINKHHEPRERPHGSFFLREGDEAKPARGDPVLPLEFVKFLDPLVTASVVRVVRADGMARPQAVLLDVGRDRGVKAGTRFVAEDSLSVLLNVTDVNDNTSEAEVYNAELSPGVRVIARIVR